MHISSAPSLGPVSRRNSQTTSGNDRRDIESQKIPTTDTEPRHLVMDEIKAFSSIINPTSSAIVSKQVQNQFATSTFTSKSDSDTETIVLPEVDSPSAQFYKISSSFIGAISGTALMASTTSNDLNELGFTQVKGQIIGGMSCLITGLVLECTKLYLSTSKTKESINEFLSFVDRMNDKTNRTMEDVDPTLFEALKTIKDNYKTNTDSFNKIFTTLTHLSALGIGVGADMSRPILSGAGVYGVSSLGHMALTAEAYQLNETIKQIHTVKPNLMLFLNDRLSTPEHFSDTANIVTHLDRIESDSQNKTTGTLVETLEQYPSLRIPLLENFYSTMSKVSVMVGVSVLSDQAVDSGRNPGKLLFGVVLPNIGLAFKGHITTAQIIQQTHTIYKSAKEENQRIQLEIGKYQAKLEHIQNKLDQDTYDEYSTTLSDHSKLLHTKLATYGEMAGMAATAILTLGAIATLASTLFETDDFVGPAFGIVLLTLSSIIAETYSTKITTRFDQSQKDLGESTVSYKIIKSMIDEHIQVQEEANAQEKQNLQHQIDILMAQIQPEQKEASA